MGQPEGAQCFSEPAAGLPEGVQRFSERASALRASEPRIRARAQGASAPPRLGPATHLPGASWHARRTAPLAAGAALRHRGTEQALLITLVTVHRFSSPGGVVLLDEPELHQHLSLMRGSLATLEHLVVRLRGVQLIVASHAPEVWAHFRGAGALVELKGRG